MEPRPADDTGGSHTVSGSARDVIDVEWWADDASLGGLVRLDVRPDLGRTALLVAVVGPDRAPAVVLDHDLPLASGSLELRGSGVWVDLVCETPLDHWTVGLEAFGLEVDGSASITPATVGDRVPVGLDLDLDTVGVASGAPGGFRVGLRVHGEVLVADAVLELDGHGVRRRRWDGDDPVLDDGGVDGSVASVAVSWPRASGPSAPSPRRHLVGDRTAVRWVAASH